MPSPNRKLSLRSRIKNRTSQAQMKLSSAKYEFTAARQRALEAAQKASAEARRLAGKKVGGSQGLSSVQIIANRFANRLTGSKTSALRKRQTVKAQISTTAKTAGSTARALTGTASTLYKGYKSEATKKINRTLSNARGNLSYRMNRSAADAYKRSGALQNMSRVTSRGGDLDRATGVGRTTLKGNYTQAGQSMQAGKTMLAAKNANRSKSGPTGTTTAKSAYSMGTGNTPKATFISKEIMRATKRGATPAAARKTAESKWKLYQVQQRKNKRVTKL